MTHILYLYLGFVTYSDASMVDVVQSNRPHTIDGAKVETKRATPREDGGSGKSVKKIFVGGFKDKLEDSDLQTFFSAFGNVTSARQVLEKGSDKKLGFGFVEFDDYDAVDKIVISGSSHVINGVRVDVRKAFDKNDAGGGFGGNNRRGDKGQWGGGQGFGNFGDSFGNQGGWGQQSGWGNRGSYGNQGGGGFGNGWQNSGPSSNAWADQGNSWGGPGPTNNYTPAGNSWGGGFGNGGNMAGGGGAMRNNPVGNRSTPYPSGGRGGLRGGRGGGSAPAGQGRW